MIGKEPFSPEFKAQLGKSLLFTVKCSKCDFETYLFEGFNTVTGVQKQIKEHFAQEHKISLPVGRPR